MYGWKRRFICHFCPESRCIIRASYFPGGTKIALPCKLPICQVFVILLEQMRWSSHAVYLHYSIVLIRVVLPFWQIDVNNLPQCLPSLPSPARPLYMRGSKMLCCSIGENVVRSVPYAYASRSIGTFVSEWFIQCLKCSVKLTSVRRVCESTYDQRLACKACSRGFPALISLRFTVHTFCVVAILMHFDCY